MGKLLGRWVSGGAGVVDVIDCTIAVSSSAYSPGT
jgi:hypothetical protein